MTNRIKRAVAGVAMSLALAGGAAAGAAVVTATPASASPSFFGFFPCAPHGHVMLFCGEEI
jgi:hypothetical protein